MGCGVFGLGTGEGAWEGIALSLLQDTGGGRPWRAGRMAEGWRARLVLALLHSPLPTPHPHLVAVSAYRAGPGQKPLLTARGATSAQGTWCKLESECPPAGRHSLCWRAAWGLCTACPPPPAPRSLTAGRHRPAQLRHGGVQRGHRMQGGGMEGVEAALRRWWDSLPP